jgi:hypothetical protein
LSIDIEKLIQDDLKDRTNKSLREQSLREYYNNPNYCNYCGEVILVSKNKRPSDIRQKKFCNNSCAASYNNQGVRRNYKDDVDYDILTTCLNCGNEVRRNKKYCSQNCQNEYEQNIWEEKWLNGEISGNKNSVWTQASERVRTYLFKKYNKKCSRCGWGETNPYTGKIPLEIEHIDGNANNTTPNNVTLLCPNCHSLTATYRGANRGNGRPKTWMPKIIEVDV